MHVADEGGNRDSARSEALVFARYLVGTTPPPEVVERYQQASATLFSAPPDAADVALLGFARRRPWSVPFLDAAAGILRPASALRSRLLVMAAILEASPGHAADFLPRSVSVPSLVARLAVHGVRAVALLVLGVPVYLVATRSGR